jgi:hypothetical protein
MRTSKAWPDYDVTVSPSSKRLASNKLHCSPCRIEFAIGARMEELNAQSNSLTSLILT